jgi:tight adherence protein B
MDSGLLILLAGTLSGTAVLLFCIGFRAHRAYAHWQSVRQRAHSERDHRWISALQREAAAAGLRVPGIHLAAAAGVGAAAGTAMVVVVTGRVALAPMGLLLGIITPGIWVRRRIAGRSSAFEAQLEVTLGQMAAALRAGQSVQQALEQAALSALPPAREVLGRALHLLRTGHSLVRALEEAGGQVKSRELELVAAATGLHMQTGGDLAMVYDQIADGIRDRRAFRAQVGSATSEGRLTSNVLLSMPFAAVGGMRALNPEYMAPLFNTAGGLKLLGVCAGLILAGWLLIRRIVAVEY